MIVPERSARARLNDKMVYARGEEERIETLLHTARYQLRRAHKAKSGNVLPDTIKDVEVQWAAYKRAALARLDAYDAIVRLDVAQAHAGTLGLDEPELPLETTPKPPRDPHGGRDAGFY